MNVPTEAEIAEAETMVLEAAAAVDTSRVLLAQCEHQCKLARQRAGNALANWLSETPRPTRSEMTQAYLKASLAERRVNPIEPVENMGLTARRNINTGTPNANRRGAGVRADVYWNGNKIAVRKPKA